MEKRRAYTGHYKSRISCKNIFLSIAQISSRLNVCSTMASKNLSSACDILSKNYVVVATVIFVVVLSFLLPNLSQKMQVTHDLKNLKTKINKITTEVKQAEVACLAVAEQVCGLTSTVPEDKPATSKDFRRLSNYNQSIRTTQSAPVQSEEKIGLFRRFFIRNRNLLSKETTIMSFLYTDSFDAQNRVITPNE